mmetsp:Transcript_6052/g.18073  ORF Transcript_6052/g.18073 Transcript_6052/m.18073 type:complete len:241 (+) Transcript_6052:264-986(+)
MPPAIPPMFARDISDLPPAGQSALASLAPHLKGLRLAFFNATHHVGQQAIAAGELDPDDVESMEPSVLLGLPALAALECAIDSSPFCAASRGEPDDDANDDGLVLRTLVDSAGAAHTIGPRDFPDGPTDLYRSSFGEAGGRKPSVSRRCEAAALSHAQLEWKRGGGRFRCRGLPLRREELADQRARRHRPAHCSRSLAIAPVQGCLWRRHGGDPSPCGGEADGMTLVAMLGRPRANAQSR